MILEKDGDNYTIVDGSDPVDMVDIVTNIVNELPTRFTFPAPISITKDIAVLIGAYSDDPKDGVLLYTTKEGCAVNGSWLIGVNGTSVMTVSSALTGGLNVEGAVLVSGNFTYDEEAMKGYLFIEENNIESVNMYPNPVSGNLKINNLNESTTINVYSITGQLLRSVSATGSTEIDMSDLSDGLYFVKMQNGKSVRTEKIQVIK